MTVERLVQLRGGLSPTWQNSNPILALGEMGLELDTRKMKVGDGITDWNDLPYFNNSASVDLSGYQQKNSTTGIVATQDNYSITVNSIKAELNNGIGQSIGVDGTGYVVSDISSFRNKIGLGTGNSPTFAGLTTSGNITATGRVLVGPAGLQIYDGNGSGQELVVQSPNTNDYKGVVCGWLQVGFSGGVLRGLTNGLAVRNIANNADGILTCGNLTASGGITVPNDILIGRGSGAPNISFKDYSTAAEACTIRTGTNSYLFGSSGLTCPGSVTTNLLQSAAATTLVVNGLSGSVFIQGNGTNAAQFTGASNINFYRPLSLTASGTNDSQLKVGALEIQGYAVNNSWFGDNVYFNGSNFVRRATGSTGLFYFYGEEGQFRFNASGAAGTTHGDNTQFKVHRDGTVAFGGVMASTPGNYSGFTFTANGTNVAISRYIYLGANGFDNGVQFVSSGWITNASLNRLGIYNNTKTDAPFVAFGGLTASFPGFKRTATAINFRLADDSADCPITTGAITSSSDISAGASSGIWGGSLRAGGTASNVANLYIFSQYNGVMQLYDSTVSSFNRIALGGTTPSFPAIKRNGTAINFRLADDSADTSITASALSSSGDLVLSSNPANSIFLNTGSNRAGGVFQFTNDVSSTFWVRNNSANGAYHGQNYDFKIRNSNAIATINPGNYQDLYIGDEMSGGTVYTRTRTIVFPGNVTGSNSTASLQITQTWNTTGTPTAFDVNVTDTASNANSLVSDWKVNGASVRNINKAGYHRNAQTSADGVFPLFSGGGWGTDNLVRVINQGGIQWQFQVSGGTAFSISPGIFSAVGSIGISAAGSLGGDVVAARDAANTWGFRNSTNAQRVNLYGTYTDTSNLRRFFISSTTSGDFRMGVEGLGTGASGNTLTIANGLVFDHGVGRPITIASGANGFRLSTNGINQGMRIERGDAAVVADFFSTYAKVCGSIFVGGTVGGSSTDDVAVGRTSAGVAEINNGTVGTLRGLNVLSLGIAATHSLSDGGGHFTFAGNGNGILFTVAGGNAVFGAANGTGYRILCATNGVAIGANSTSFSSIDAAPHLQKESATSARICDRLNTTRLDLRLKSLVADGAITSVIDSLSTDPVMGTDLTAGQTRIIKNTSTGVVKGWVNDGGTPKSVTYS